MSVALKLLNILSFIYIYKTYLRYMYIYIYKAYLYNVYKKKKAYILNN